MRLPPPPPVARAVAATPHDRDRVLDLMRAGALALVVLGHGCVGVVAWTATGPIVSSLLAVYGWLAWGTWLLQIMPLFFLAGGAANARSWRSAVARLGDPTAGTPYAAWAWGRVARLLRPVWAYLLIMAPVSGLLSVLAPTSWSEPLLGLATQLLWFIGVYVVVCALTPLAVRAHRRSPWLAPPLLLGVVALIDLARLGLGLPMALGLLNFVFVWALAAQLGLLFDDRLLRGWRGLALAGGALTANLLLMTVGPYPISMIGVTGDRFSNMAPPSLALALHTVVLAGLAGWARPALARLAERRRVWHATTAINLTAMTLYLWHLPVLIALVAGLHLVGLDRPVLLDAAGHPVPAPGFWLSLLPFLALFLACVAGMVRLLWPVEVGRLPGWDRPARTQQRGVAGERRAGAAAGLGAAAVGVGTLALASTGLSGFPTRVAHFAGVPLNSLAAIGLMLGGGLLVRHAGAERSSEVRSRPNF